MMVKNTCLICGNDDPDQMTVEHEKEVCLVCDNRLIESVVIGDKPVDSETSYSKLF